MYKQSLIHSFWSAFKGLKHQLRERNFVIQILIGVLAIALSLALSLPRNDKIVVLLLVAFVLAAEAMNSACERMLNFVTKEPSPEVARIKEMLAAAVLIYSITAAVIGIWIFGNALLK